MPDPTGRPRGLLRSALALLLSIAMIAFGATGALAGGSAPDLPAAPAPPRAQEATWELSQQAEPGPGTTVAPGDQITYTLTAGALGVRPATGVAAVVDLAGVLEHATLVEPLPAGLTRAGDELVWDVRHPVHPNRPASLSYTVTVDSNAAAAAFTSVARPSDAVGTCADCTLAHNVAHPGWQVSARAATATGVTIPHQGTVRPNGQLNYHLSAQNTSASPVSGGVVVADVSGLLPYADIEAVGAGAELDTEAEVVRWSVPDLSPDESAEVSFRANLRFSDAPNAVLPLTVATEGGGGECVSGCELVHYATGFRATMNAAPQSGAVEPGEQITYTWEVANTSRAQISGATVTAQLRDVLEHAALVEPLADNLRLISITGPTIMRWQVPDLGPEETARVSFSVIVDDDAAPGAELGTRITAGANSFGISYGDRDATHTVAAPSWKVTVDPRVQPGTTVLTNTTFGFPITVQNTSGQPVLDAEVAADLSGLMEHASLIRLPQGAVYDESTQRLTWSVPDLDPHASVTEELRVRISAPARGSELNAHFAAVGENGECVGECEFTYHVYGFDAALSADPPAGAVAAGDRITYTMHVQNISGGELSGAQVRMHLNDVTAPILESADLVEPLDEAFALYGNVLAWHVPDLEAGESAEVTFAVQVHQDSQAGAQLRGSINTYTARHGGLAVSDPVWHGVDEVSWEVSARAAQANGVTIPNEGTVRPNGQVNYHLDVTNTSGLSVSEGEVVADVSGLVPYATIQAITAGGEYDAENGLVRWQLSGLEAGASTSLSFRANLRLADAPGAVLPLSVSAQGPGGTCVTGCELVHYATAVEASVSASPASGQIQAGDEITYTWQLRNTSQAVVSGAYVRAQMGPVLEHAELLGPLPDGVDFAVGTVLNWEVPELQAGQSAQVSFTVVVDPDAEPDTELQVGITAGPSSFGVDYAEQDVTHSVTAPVSPPTPSLPPFLAVLLGLAKIVFGLLIWLF